MAGAHTTVVGSAVGASPGRNVINHRLPERSPASRARTGVPPAITRCLVVYYLGKKFQPRKNMTQSQSRSTSPASWQPGMPEREGLWIFTRLRDFIDSIANSSPARLALSAFGVVILVFTALLSLPLASATGQVTPLHQAFFTASSAV